MDFSNQFSFQELYDVKIKSTYKREIDKKVYEEGETIWSFDHISISNFNEVKKYTAARGGFDNRPHVIWESTDKIDLSFSQGIFNAFEYAMFTNGKFVTSSPDKVKVSQREVLETNEDMQVTLKYLPIGNIFAYDKETGEKLKFTQNEQILTFEKEYLEVVIDYQFYYQSNVKEIIIGTEVLSGYLEFEGKTKVKDDVTGLVHTGIIKIPKLKLMSKLSIRLGENANPVVGNFSAAAFPVGVKGNIKAMEFILLEEDIDSDM